MCDFKCLGAHKCYHTTFLSRSGKHSVYQLSVFIDIFWTSNCRRATWATSKITKPLDISTTNQYFYNKSIITLLHKSIFKTLDFPISRFLKLAGLLWKTFPNKAASKLIFHDDGPCHVQTSPLICSANHWTGF